MINWLDIKSQVWNPFNFKTEIVIKVLFYRLKGSVFHCLFTYQSLSHSDCSFPDDLSPQACYKTKWCKKRALGRSFESFDELKRFHIYKIPFYYWMWHWRRLGIQTVDWKNSTMTEGLLVWSFSPFFFFFKISKSLLSAATAQLETQVDAWSTNLVVTLLLLSWTPVAHLSTQ